MAGSSETQEIEHRLHLLTFAQDPERTWDYFAQVLNLQFTYQQEHAVDQGKPDLPTTLDPALIERQRFLRDALGPIPRWRYSRKRAVSIDSAATGT